MQKLFSEKVTRWLLPAVLILFILEVLTLPLVLGITYAGRNETPNHTLTYTPGKLAWDNATGIDGNGVAKLDLFDAVYYGVKSVDGSNVIAPGTKGDSIVRLKNSASGSVNYTAVLYRICTNENIPVEAAFIGSSFTDTDNYALPDGVAAHQILHAITGTVNGGEIQDFDISWIWEYEACVVQNEMDTFHNDHSEVTVGLYIVVVDDNGYVSPDAPQASRKNHIGMYITLILISLIILILLLRDRRKEKECA